MVDELNCRVEGMEERINKLEDRTEITNLHNREKVHRKKKTVPQGCVGLTKSPTFIS